MTIFLVFLMYALFATVFPLGKVILSYCPPFLFTAIRMGIAGLILLGILKFKKMKRPQMNKTQWGLLLCVAIFNVFITNGLEFWGLQFMGSAKTALLYSLSPFVAIGATFFILKEKISLKKMSCLSLGLLGFIPLYLLKEETLLEKTSILPEIAVSCSAIGAAFGWTFVKKLTTSGISVAWTNSMSFIIAAAISLVISLFFEDLTLFQKEQWMNFILILLAIVLIHNLVCYHLYGQSLKKLSVVFLSFAGFSCPLFTAIFANFFLNEPFTFNFFLSFFLILTGLGLYWKIEKQERLKE